MKRILVISPHPDDETIGCGGTLRSHVVRGDMVRFIFLTSGEKGGHGRPEAETAAAREKEAAAAAAILGIDVFEFWKLPDGALRVSGNLINRLRNVINDLKPNFIYVTHEKEMLSDHRAAARLVKRCFSGPRAIKFKPIIRMFEVWTPLQQIDEIVDISEFIEVKIAAVQAYKSQCDVMRFDKAVRGLNRYRGEMHSWPGGDYAEIFTRMDV